MQRIKLTLLVLLVFALSASPLSAASAYTFAGVASDGRTVSFQYVSPGPITASVVVSGSAVSCTPACDSVGIFPNAQQGYDQVVFDARNVSGPPTSLSFFLPFGAFANPGNYNTISVAGSSSSGSLSSLQTGVPAIGSPNLLANGSVGLAYSASFSASGGTAPYAFTTDLATLPPGLTLTSAGLLSGTPTTAGQYSFSVKVTDAANAFSSRLYTVSFAAGVNIATKVLPGTSLGAAYNQSLTATGGTGIYTWALATGSLPPGLSLSPAGVIGGVSTAGGGYFFSVRVTDSAAATITANLTITVSSQVSITTVSPLPSASVNTPYTLSLAALGGTQPYSWSLVSGSLPAGVSLAANGTLSGTPTSSANYFFDLRVADAAGASATRTYQMFVGTGVVIDSSPAPNGTIGVPYSKTMAAVGGTAPYTWSVIGGSLPPGITLSTAGVLGGTPTTPGVYPITVRATDSTAGSSFTNLSITILPAVTITTPPTLPTGTPGSAYSVVFTATGGAGPYGWQVASGTLPAGLTLSPAGTLSGTPTTGGNYNFVVRATDSSSAYTMQSYTLTVGSALVVTTPSLLPNGTAGVQYAQSLAATGGNPPYIWTVTSGSVPAGLTLATSGVLSGTPLTGGSFTFVARVTDASALSTLQTFTLNIGTGLAITTPPQLPNGVPGVLYSQTLAAVGGTVPYSWTVVGGTFPAGLVLAPNGILSGIPTTAGTYSFQVRVTDAVAANTTQTFALNIGTGLTITTPAQLPPAVVAQAYSQAFAAAGGTLPYTWTIAGGAVPPGLLFSAQGALTGTPTAQGSYFFTVRVTDATSANVMQNYSLTVSTGLVITTTSPLPNAAVSVPYSQALVATGGVAPYTWSLISGTLAPGLSIANNGAVTGTPLLAGNYSFGVRVSDSTGASATATLALTVGSGISITTATLPNGAIGVPYSQTLVAAGGTAPYVWSLGSGTLPPGLTLANSGVLSGTPTFVGQFTFTIRVADNTTATAERPYTVTVNPGITITTPSPLPNGAFGIVYFQMLMASGGVAPYAWSVSSGALPPGLTLAANGTLSGTPTSGGAYTFVARVADSVNTTATQTYVLNVNAGITITTTSPLPEASVGANYFLTFGASGGTGPYTWTVFSGALPPGLTLAPTGSLTGTPAVAGTFNFTIRLADSAQVSTQTPFSLSVNSGNVYPRSGVISQIASGGGWKTTITLINPGAAQANTRVNIYAGDGTPLSLPLTLTQGANSVSVVAAVVDRTIPPGGTLIIESEAGVSATAVGWADVRSTTPVSGYAIFRQKHGSGVDSEGTASVENRLQASVIIPMDNLAGYSTGVALVNIAADAQASVTVIMRDENGAEIARDALTVPANGHTSFSLPDRFPILKGRRGTVEFATNAPAGITGLGLRFSPSLSFTSVPAIVR